MKRVLSMSLCVFIIIGAITGGVIIAKDVAGLRDIETSIKEQLDLQAAVFDEKAKLRDQVAAERERLSEVPDSLEATKAGSAMRSSLVIAKAETRLDHDNMRIKRILRELDRNQTALRESVKKKGVIAVGVEILLIVGLIVVRRLVA